MRKIASLVAAAVLLSATCLQIPTLASYEGQETENAAVTTRPEVDSPSGLLGRMIDAARLRREQTATFSARVQGKGLCVNVNRDPTKAFDIKTQIEGTFGPTRFRYHIVYDSVTYFRDMVGNDTGEAKVLEYEEVKVYDGELQKEFDPRSKRGAVTQGEPIFTGTDPRNLWLNYGDRPLEEYLSEGETSELGYFELEGRKCVVLQAPYKLADGSVSEGLAYRFWFDASEDMFPVRMEYGRLQAGGQFVVVKFVETSQVGQTRDGVRYPLKCTTEWHRSSEGERILARQMVFTFAEFKPNVPAPDSLFELDFPDGTLVQGLAGSFTTGVAGRAKPLLAGKQAPHLDVAEWVDDEHASLESLEGRVLVLAFWDSRHRSCTELIEGLNALAEKHRDVELIAVHSADSDPDALRKLAKEKNAAFHVALDKSSFDAYPGATFEEYGVKEIPAIFILDPEGMVRYQDIPLAAVEEAVRQLLDEQ